MTKKLHGKAIELVQDPGMAEGQEVELQLEFIPSTSRWGQGIRRSAGLG